MKFEKTSINDVTEAIYSGGTPSTKVESYWNGDLYWLSSGETKNRFINATEKTISIDGVKNSSTKLAKLGDVVIASAGQGHTRGQVAFLQTDTYINQSVIALRANNTKVLPLYLFYNLSNRYEEIRQLSDSNSSRGSLTTKILKEMDILIPSLKEQNNIASFLFKLDSKIEINKQLVINLEELSQTIFKYWFIDFEFPNEEGLPYKSSGGKMVESELGEIPTNWQVGTIGDLGSVIGGGTPSKKEESYYTENGISWITPKDLSNNKNKFIYHGAIDITDLGLAKSSAKLMPKGTVLFSSRAPIGYIAIAGKEVTTNQGFKSIIPDKGYSNIFIYFLLHQMLPTIESNAGGSTFKEISGQGLKSIEIYLPSIKVVEEFTNVVMPLFEQIKVIEKEIENLEGIRDSLLPKLLSGEIEIPDESVVG